MFDYDFQVPESRKLRYIVHTDCKNEADDQYTLAHILMTPKLDVRGIVACHFAAKNSPDIAPDQTMQASYDEILKIMDLMHVSGEKPVFKGGATFMPDEETPADPAAADALLWVYWPE